MHSICLVEISRNVCILTFSPLLACTPGYRPARQTAALRMSVAMPVVPFDSVTPVGASGPTLPGSEDLDFLEAKPYWDQTNVPVCLPPALQQFSLFLTPFPRFSGQHCQAKEPGHRKDC